MDAIRRTLAGLGALGLALVSTVVGAGNAEAATISAVEVTPYESYDWAEIHSGRTVEGLQARVWCNDDYDPATRPAEELVEWDEYGYPLDRQAHSAVDLAQSAARIHVDVPYSVADDVHQVDLSGATCDFVRFWESPAAAASGYINWPAQLHDDGLRLTVDLLTAAGTTGDPENYGGSGGFIFGQTAEGRLFPVYLEALKVEGPFIPETGDPEPEPTPEPEPVPDPEPTPVVEEPVDPPVFVDPPVYVDPPAVPETPTQPDAPVVEPEEPVEPFKPDTGIEVDGGIPTAAWLGAGLLVVMLFAGRAVVVCLALLAAAAIRVLSQEGNFR